MEKAKFLETLIKEQGYNLKSFAAACDIPYTTLYGIIKNGVGKAGVANMLTICRHLGITVEELEEMAAGQEEPKKPAGEPNFYDIENLIARNGGNLSPEEKLRLIQLLSELT